MTLPDDPLKWAIDAFKDGRSGRYAEYQAYIDGNQPLVFATDKFKSAFGRTFEAFAYNRSEAVVDAHADRLQVSGFGADDPAVAQRAQDIWDMNQMDVREGHFEVDAFGLGDGYTIGEVNPETSNPQIWVQTPSSVRIHYSDEVPGKRDLAVKTWQDESKYQRLNLYFADRVEKYISINRAPSGIPISATAFQRYAIDGDESWTFLTNITDTVPVFPFANNARTSGYGRSELLNVLPLQDALNKSILDMLVAMEFAAYPQRIITGLDTEPDDATKDMIRRFELGLTRIMTLYGDNVKPAEFSAANIAQYIAVCEFFDMAISRVTKVPIHYLQGVASGTSGRTYRMAETAFTKKMIDRQRQVQTVIAEMMTYLVRSSGMNVKDGAIRVNWEPVAPMGEEDRWDLIGQKVTAGLPLYTALREDGYEPDQIDTIREESMEAADRARAIFERGDQPDDIPAAEDEDEEEAA